jgi:hypothetical protein
MSRQNNSHILPSHTKDLLYRKATCIVVQSISTPKTFMLRRTGDESNTFEKVIQNILDGISAKTIFGLTGVNELEILRVDVFDSNVDFLWGASFNKGALIGVSTSLKDAKGHELPAVQYVTGVTSKNISISSDIPESASTDAVANELANLCKALNAYHIARGGNGLEIDSWEILVRELVRV